MDKIFISNPVSLQTALKIATEVSFADLSKYQMDNIKDFISQLPNKTDQTSVEISTDHKIDLVMCIRYFYQSTTYRWIRGDLSNALNDLEYQIISKQPKLRDVG